MSQKWLYRECIEQWLHRRWRLRASEKVVSAAAVWAGKIRRFLQQFHFAFIFNWGYTCTSFINTPFHCFNFNCFRQTMRILGSRWFNVKMLMEIWETCCSGYAYWKISYGNAHAFWLSMIHCQEQAWWSIIIIIPRWLSLVESQAMESEMKKMKMVPKVTARKQNVKCAWAILFKISYGHAGTCVCVCEGCHLVLGNLHPAWPKRGRARGKPLLSLPYLQNNEHLSGESSLWPCFISTRH